MSPAEELATRYTIGVLRIRYPSIEDLNVTGEDGLCALWRHDDPLFAACYLAGLKDLAKAACHLELEAEVDMLYGVLKTRSQ